MKSVQKGFTLIELMVVIAIIGVLAATALPAYQDYTTRAKISEVVLQLDSCKTLVASFILTSGLLPSSAAQAGCDSAFAGKYMAAGLSVSAAGVITSGAVQGTNSTADGMTINLVPTSDAPRTTPITQADLTAGLPVQGWSCYTGALPALYKFVPANCRQASPAGGL
jgi:type IV pilus assembly protein PilA